MKILNFLLIGLTFCQISCGQTTQTDSTQAVHPKFEEGTSNSTLWQITKEGSTDTSFVFGTMHLIQKEYFYFPEALKALIASSDLVVLEIGEEMNDPAAAMKMLKLEEGKSFFDYFNAEQKDSILNWAKETLSMEEKAFNASFGKMKPFVVSMMAAEYDMMASAESYEKTIMSIQKKNKVQLKGLETLADQMKLFDDFSDTEQAAMVMESIKNDPEAKNDTKKMMEIYHRQNIDSLHILILEEGGTISSKEEELLSNRNKNWIPKIEKMIADKRVFIAVGAGHLGGEQSVLELLRKQGYTVTPLKL